jgi:hypothetical protein
MTETVQLEAAWAVIADAIKASNAATKKADKDFLQWLKRVREFSELCAKKNLKSYIAVLGNAMLAKASNRRVDVFSLKAGDQSPGAYDARRPAENVLVPASQTHRFSLGATGPQPLNNQPFFRSYRIDTSMKVKANAKPVLSELIKLLHEVSLCNRADAVLALAAFIVVRREYVPTYAAITGSLAVGTAGELASVLRSFVGERSDGGARAQASTGGLFDAWFSAERVRVGKKNEPDRKVPGDVAIQDKPSGKYTRVFEVRDKVVPLHAALAFIAKVAGSGIARAGIVAVATDQKSLDHAELDIRAREAGIDLQLFTGWIDLVRAVVFAAETRELATVESAVARIRVRLIELEVPTTTVSRWDELTLRSEAGEI